MKLIIDQKIFEQNNDLKIGAILIKGMNNSKRVSAVESLLRGVCAQRAKEFADKEVYDHPMIQPWSQAYGKFGINPKKYPPSIAALLKRIKSGKEIPHINLLVDIYNYFSLKYVLPIGGEDLDWLCGDLNLTFTKGGEPFRPIGSIEVDQAQEGEAAYMDNGGITCKYWNYRECERTKFTAKTVNAVLLIEDLSKMHMDQFGMILKEIESTIVKYIGGQTETHILNEENCSLDLGIVGRKHADDSKIPLQEKVHFMEKEHVPLNPPENEEEPKKKVIKSLIPELTLDLNDKGLLKSRVSGILLEAVKNTFPNADISEVKIEYPKDEAHGDYASSIALQLGKVLNSSPREVADNLVRNIPENDLVERVEIAGPGFINFFIKKSFYIENIQNVLANPETYGQSEIGKDRTVIVEYSQPNIAKPLGIHHLLSTIIGQSTYNIFKNLGFNTVGINYIGDWGTQFGKLICAYKKWGNKETIEKNPIDELLKLYVRFHNEAEQDPKLEDEGRKEFKNFEDGDKENRELWEWFVKESLQEIQKTYDLLGGIHFDYIQGESFYEDKMDAILKDGKKKKVFVKGEEGALVIHYEDSDIPTVPIQKKDGATLYITRDFAALKYRIDTWKPAKILYVVDSAQSLHFKQLLAGATKLGWYNGEAEHVPFGRMQFKDSKMSTRKGNIILLDEVLKEAVERAEKIIAEKSPELKDRKQVAKVIGIGAVKYNVLSQNRATNIVFDWDKMLSLDGNSAPYLQYSYARACSIMRKASAIQEVDIGDLREDKAKSDEKIRALIAIFPKYGEYLNMAAKEYRPNILSNYLFELAQKFNTFYNSVPVIKVADLSERKYRLDIVRAASAILKSGLMLLGVEVVEEM
ncbi:arginine--tRNA ligase [Candidatus Gracilibacteria bacterium]|nr:arginine--tRNA ligase [Candidatus Gracilibacteria bacterium]